MQTITGLVPYLHVRDVLKSQKFYELFGLKLDSRFGPEDEPYSARLKAPNCDLMLAKSSGAIDFANQAVLFFLYVPDVAELRRFLLDNGLADGGPFGPSVETEGPHLNAVFEIHYPFYMPEGELRVHDPDGYVLLVGQLEPLSTKAERFAEA